MQPVAVVTCPTEGIVSVNGRFFGECGPDAPVLLPVGPNATLYIEIRPFGSQRRGCVHRLRFSGGVPAISEDPGVYLLRWPGNIFEIQLTPPPAFVPESEFTMLDGIPVALLQGIRPMLRVAGQALALPDGAELPHGRVVTDAGDAYPGRFRERAYLALFARKDGRPLDLLCADQIEPEGDGFRCFTDLRDTVGHRRSDVFLPTENGFRLLETEFVWTDGHPRRPKDAQEIALAMLEAAFLGLNGEAQAFLSPYAVPGVPLRQLIRPYTGCLPLRYAPTDGLPSVGLVRRDSARSATVHRLTYRAVPGDPVLLEKLQILT